MKKLLAVFLTLSLMISLVACGGGGDNGSEQTSEKPKFDYANMNEYDLIEEFIKDEKEVTLDEYVNLASTYSYVTIKDDLTLEENITDKAIQKLKRNGAKLPTAKEYVEPLIKSDSPQVRGYAFTNMSSFLGVSNENVKIAKEAIKNEKDPYAIKCALRSLSTLGAKDEEIGKFLIDAAKNENAAVRKEAARCIAVKQNQGLKGAVEAELELMNDSDIEVRKAAYQYTTAVSGEDDRVLDAISKMLKNEADIDLHSSGLAGLEYLWYNYPFHENTSEKAYRITMDYLNGTYEDGNIPHWSAVTNLSKKSDSNFGSWKERATYFDTNEIYETMVAIVKNTNLSTTTRSSTCKVVATQCSREQYEKFGEVVNSLSDDDSGTFLIKSRYETYK